MCQNPFDSMSRHLVRASLLAISRRSVGVLANQAFFMSLYIFLRRLPTYLACILYSCNTLSCHPASNLGPPATDASAARHHRSLLWPLRLQCNVNIFFHLRQDFFLWRWYQDDIKKEKIIIQQVWIFRATAIWWKINWAYEDPNGSNFSSKESQARKIKEFTSNCLS